MYSSTCQQQKTAYDIPKVLYGNGVHASPRYSRRSDIYEIYEIHEIYEPVRYHVDYDSARDMIYSFWKLAI